jgi:hypothetical protein
MLSALDERDGRACAEAPSCCPPTPGPASVRFLSRSIPVCFPSDGPPATIGSWPVASAGFVPCLLVSSLRVVAAVRDVSLVDAVSERPAQPSASTAATTPVHLAIFICHPSL